MTTEWDEYVQAHAACESAHAAMLASRSTLITIQSRLREAAIEEATDQVAYLEGRVTVLEPVVDRRTHDVAVLSGEVEERRVRAVTNNVDTALSVLSVLVSMMEQFSSQMPDPADALATTATLAERTVQDATTLPQGRNQQRIAATELHTRVRMVQDLYGGPAPLLDAASPDGGHGPIPLHHPVVLPTP